jgi:hypothetical protein
LIVADILGEHVRVRTYLSVDQTDMPVAGAVVDIGDVLNPQYPS